VLDALLAERVDAEQAIDVQLACSELVTNGLLHAEAVEVTVDMEITPDRITLHISYPDTGVIVDAAAAMPESGQVTGRGLAIVDRIATTFESTLTDQWRTLMTATFARLPAA